MPSVVWFHCQACGKLVKRRKRSDRNLLCLECAIAKDRLTIRLQHLGGGVRRVSEAQKGT